MYVYFSVNSLLNVRLSFCEERKKNVSVLELPGDVLIVPQVGKVNFSHI